LKKKFYINVPFDMPQLVIEEAVAAFFRFLEEPESIKTEIDINIAPLHRRGDIGYRQRDASDHIYNDSKEFFHYHPDIFKKYDQFLKQNPITLDFMLKAKSIWELSYQAVENILKTFESDFPGVYDKIFKTESPHVMLRFLKYDWQKSGKYLAKPHFDAGSFTLAIAESCQGLRIGSRPENLELVEHKAGNAIFMLSSNFQKVIPNDKLSAGWHDVIQLDETIIGKPFARWAVVAFIEAHGVHALPRSETHKWYQEEA
jgi:isopenicillin N synthase-like dioxygenase